MTADLLLEAQDVGMGVAVPISIVDLDIGTAIAVFFNLILASCGMLEVILQFLPNVLGGCL